MLKKFLVGITTLTLSLLPVVSNVPTASAAANNPIVNPSVEDGATTPTGWTSNSWSSGTTNTPVFEYVTNDSHTGSKSVKITMSNYGTDGDAKWRFDPISTSVLPVGSQHRFTVWYKTNVIPK